MLPLPILDDEKFEDIFTDAKRQIPGLTSEWTDFNYHDPGITLLQFLAWLKEMQQFYIDGIGDVHRLKYLKLLNYLPNKVKSAVADVSLSGISSDIQLPRGTKFNANGIIFETSKDFFLLANTIKCLQHVKDEQYVDISHVIDGNGTMGMSEYLFGQKPSSGDALLIGFEKELPVFGTISIHAQLFYEKYISRNSITDEVYPLAKLKWEYWNGIRWKDINIQTDETFGFIKDGYIHFTIDSKMQAELFGACCKKLYWLRCTLLECNYDLSPKISSLTINTVEVSQRDTQCEALTLEYGCLQNTYLSLYGKIEIQARREDGLWEKWENVLIETDEISGQKLTILPDENGLLPKICKENIRAICMNDEESKYIIADSTGYPTQTYDINFENILENDFWIQVGIKQGEKMLWQDWTRTEDLLTNSMDDLCFQLDTKLNLIKFGDGKHGAIPPKGIENIRIISCSLSLGIRGNVKNGEISSIIIRDTQMQAMLEAVNIENTKYAYGGSNAENIDDAIFRFRKDFSKVSRAITCEDYETFVMNTPGLIIQKAHAIPNYKKGKGYLGESADNNCVTLVVKAYSDQTPQPELNEAYLKNIKRHINKYRLVTTEVEVIPPCYIGIDVFCMIQVKPYYKDVKYIISDFLKKEFDAINGKRNFGQDIEYGDIYGMIESLNCVKKVISLSLDTRDIGASKKPGGGIQIPPHGLTYLRLFEIEIKE